VLVDDSLGLGSRLVGLRGNVVLPRYRASCRVKQSYQKRVIDQKLVPCSSPSATIACSGEQQKILEGRTKVQFPL